MVIDKFFTQILDKIVNVRQKMCNVNCAERQVLIERSGEFLERPGELKALIYVLFLYMLKEMLDVNRAKLPMYPQDVA